MRGSELPVGQQPAAQVFVPGGHDAAHAAPLHVDAQLEQAAPPLPHAPTAEPALHSLPAQQPAQLAALHTHMPAAHARPAPHPHVPPQPSESPQGLPTHVGVHPQ